MANATQTAMNNLVNNVNGNGIRKGKVVFAVSQNCIDWAQAHGYRSTVRDLETMISEYRAQQPAGDGYHYTATEKLIALRASHERSLAKLEAELAQR